MSLDLSGVANVVKDTLRTADEYATHDPKLAAELSLKAYEICREFDIDVTAFDDGAATTSTAHRLRADNVTFLDQSLERDGARVRPVVAEDQDQLEHILNLQRTLIDEQSTRTGHDRGRGAAGKPAALEGVQLLTGRRPLQDPSKCDRINRSNPGDQRGYSRRKSAFGRRLS